MRLVRILPLGARLHHVQGIDVEGKSLWVTSVDRAAKKGYLHLLALPSGDLVREVDVGEGERFHPGGISVEGSSVWLPVAEYRREGRSTVQRRDKRTLALLSSFEVNDHVGCVAARGNLLIGGNWDSRLIYSWDTRGQLLRTIENPAQTAYQDLKFQGNELVASGTLSREEGSIDWLDPRSLRLRRRIRAGLTDRGVRFTNEGMALRGRTLYLLPEDGPSRLFEFRM